MRPRLKLKQMSQRSFTCDICSAPMELEQRLPNYKKGGKQIRHRRFKCTFCDYKKTIFASGDADENFIPERGIKQAEAIARRESKNRDF